MLDLERIPKRYHKEKTYFIHGPVRNENLSHKLHMRGSVDKPITFSGDDIKLNLTIENNSGKKVQSVKIRLKQIWHYGGIQNNIILFKTTRKDKNFPLGDETWHCQLPISIPKVDFKPSITNAGNLNNHFSILSLKYLFLKALIRCEYYFSIRAYVHLGLDLKIRVPLQVGSCPPMIIPNQPAADQAQSNQSALNQVQSNQTTTTKPKQFEWDAPSSYEGQIPSPTLQPTRTVPNSCMSSNINTGQTQDRSLFMNHFDQFSNQLQRKIMELDYLIQCASSGKLAEVKNKQSSKNKLSKIVCSFRLWRCQKILVSLIFNLKYLRIYLN